jgi:hypothetical protein
VIAVLPELMSFDIPRILTGRFAAVPDSDGNRERLK